MLVASLWLALVVAIPFAVAMTVTVAALAAMAALLVGYGSARVVVVDDVLHAGRAQIDTRHIGAATALDAQQMRLLAGRDADARAFLLLRPYLKRGVRIELTDPADPTPYWLVGSRHPERLAAALHR